ncbi:MAG: MBL fold metallo-hydrolase [Nitrososphaerota archaeon]|nr:MBL fold metallo-hydrolase [Candidatus Bathyarchaeota archaeon]MDW8049317.1 MBL fold metallo-hydrolase [Nitrososphaerota archaeon]
MFEIIFLGTGGGRFAMVTQKFRTGGIRILSEGVNVHIDPGPGALIYSLEAGLDPKKVDAVLVSHCHLDHTNDACVMIEAMTEGTTRKRGLLCASRSVLEGNEVCDKEITSYHRALPEKVVETRVGTSFPVGNILVKVCKAVHTDPDTVGFRFETADYGGFAYIPDSEYFSDMREYYGGVRLLILSVLRPSGKPWKGHMSTDEAVKAVADILPEKVVITHFGMLMVSKGADHEAKIIEKSTGIPTIAAKDGMRLIFGREIVVSVTKRGEDLSRFL